MKKFALLATTVLASPVLAQSAPETTRDPVHGDEDRVIIVTADFIDELDILAGTSVVTGDDLLRDLEPQIGDILADQPGVSATSFSPGASRPVLRGLQGERVRVLTDGIGTLDVSNTSVDHAVTIDPLVTERIWLLLPFALLFIGFGFANPSLQSLISRTAPESMRGGAMGIAQSASSLGRILGPAWAGYAFVSIGVAWPFFSGTAILVPIIFVTIILTGQISRAKQG